MGGSDFGFAFGDTAGSAFRSSSSAATSAWCCGKFPTTLLTFEAAWARRRCIKACATGPAVCFLVTGPTGSGKSTTLASMIDYINDNVDHHIITIEDPIEFYHYHKKSTVNQREVGVDVPSFSEAIRRALRQDPDVILVGEMRDLATIEAAITAAETGHMVFGTLHTTGAQGTVNRIIDVFPDQSAGTNSRAAFDGHHRRVVASAVAEDRRRARCGVRNAGGRSRPSPT